MKITNLKKSPYDARDYKFVSTVTSSPSKVDLRAYTSPIEDQEQQGSCVANSTTTALELLTLRAGRYEDLSRQFLYYTTREYENRLGQEGSVLRDAFKMAQHYGLCLESEWQYNANLSNTKPPQSCYDSAATRILTQYEAVEISLSNVWDTVAGIKSALAEGLPVVIAFAVYDSIFRISGPLEQQDYRSYNPTTGQYYTYVGNHAVTIVGYDDYYGHFIFANSWGTSWGDQGFGALRYGMTTDVFEAWVARGFDGIEIVKPLLPGEVMTTTIKIMGTADAAGNVLIPHGTTGLQTKLLSKDMCWTDPNWGGFLRPMTFVNCDATYIRFTGGVDAAGASCIGSFTY